MARKRKVLGMGNPLLDISANVSGELLRKYKMNPNDMIFETEAQTGLYEDLKGHAGVVFTSGGATQNSIRVFAALSKTGDTASYTGCAGRDEHSDVMKQLCETNGVKTEYCVNDDNPTGVCGVCINGSNRSLCTRLGAANHYKLDFLKEKAWHLVEAADMVYSAGYFLTVCPDGMELVGRHCAEKQKCFLTNLSATFLVQNFLDVMMKVFYYADYVFGNDEEWILFAKMKNFGTTNIIEIAKLAAKLPKANVLPRVIIITQGSEATVAVHQDHDTPERPGEFHHFSELLEPEVAMYEVIALSESEIVDTNAAGDAFVGGFLHGLSTGGSLKAAVLYGHYAAAHVIKRSGCTFDFSDAPEQI
eukprot:Lankesteria_metandrocarpae@DN3315_c0_g1_i1.p1